MYWKMLASTGSGMSQIMPWRVRVMDVTRHHSCVRLDWKMTFSPLTMGVVDMESSGLRTKQRWSWVWLAAPPYWIASSCCLVERRASQSWRVLQHCLAAGKAPGMHRRLVLKPPLSASARIQRITTQHQGVWKRRTVPGQPDVPHNTQASIPENHGRGA
jgi:hypothetical protein